MSLTGIGGITGGGGGGGGGAVGTTYYVSPTGSDSNPGNSQALPWATITKVNSSSFVAGDKIYFEGGKIFNTTTGIVMNNSGSGANPITLGSYGNGNAIIKTTTSGFKSTNTSNVVVRDLTFIGTNTGAVTDDNGIWFVNTTGAYLTGIVVDSCSVHGFPQVGIYLVGGVATASGYDAARIINCIVRDCNVWGILTAIPGTLTINSASFTYPPKNRSHRNIYVAQCLVSDCLGAASYQYISGSGITLCNSTGDLIEYCTVEDCGGRDSNVGGGPVSIWFWNVTNGIIQFCEAYNQKTHQYDGGGYDIDLGCVDCIVQYSVARNCDGSGFMIYEPDAGLSVFRFNIAVNCGRRQDGQIAIKNSNTLSVSRIYNNAAFGGVVFYSTNSAYTLTNNLFIAPNGGKFIDTDSAAGQVIDNNGYWSTDGNFLVTDTGNTYTSFSAWKTALSRESTGFFANAQTKGSIGNLYNMPAVLTFGAYNLLYDDFRLKSTSPGRTMGVAVTNQGSLDFARVPISTVAGIPIGPFSVEQVITPTLTLSGPTTVSNSTNATYTISVVNPTFGSSVVFTPTPTGSPTITPTTVTLNAGNSYSTTFVLNWTTNGTYSVTGTASGFTSPTAISVTVGAASEQSIIESAIASQLPNVPSSKRTDMATAMITAASGQGYSAQDTVDMLSAASTKFWLCGDVAMCSLLSTDSTPNASLTDPVGRVVPYKGSSNFTQSGSTARPTIQSGGLRFDGSNDYLFGSYSYANPVSILVVFKRLGSANLYADVVSGDSDRNFGFVTDATDSVMYLTAAPSGANKELSPPTLNVAALTLVGQVVNGASSAAYSGLSSTTGTLVSASTSSQYIGARGNLDAATFANVEVLDVIVNTDTANVIRLLRFLKQYRGL